MNPVSTTAVSSTAQSSTATAPAPAPLPAPVSSTAVTPPQTYSMVQHVPAPSLQPEQQVSVVLAVFLLVGAVFATALCLLLRRFIAVK